jgi:hypothetical protein
MMINYEAIAPEVLRRMDIFIRIGIGGKAEIHHYSVKGREYMKEHLISYRNLTGGPGSWNPEYSDEEAKQIAYRAIDDGLHVEALTTDKFRAFEGSPEASIPGICLELHWQDAAKLPAESVRVIQHPRWPENKRFVRA